VDDAVRVHPVQGTQDLLQDVDGAHHPYSLSFLERVLERHRGAQLHLQVENVIVVRGCRRFLSLPRLPVRHGQIVRGSRGCAQLGRRLVAGAPVPRELAVIAAKRR
jgi:hypothetical protein